LLIAINERASASDFLASDPWALVMLPWVCITINQPPIQRAGPRWGGRFCRACAESASLVPILLGHVPVTFEENCLREPYTVDPV
jgi:hypothetical protein